MTSAPRFRDCRRRVKSSDIRISASHFRTGSDQRADQFAAHWLIRALPDFQAHFPNVEIRFSTTSRKLRYVGNAYDLGVRLNREPGSRFKFRTLMKDLQLPACSPEILRSRPSRRLDDLRQHTLLHSSTARSAWTQWLTLAGNPCLAPAHHLEFDHVHLQLRGALDGLGVAIASVPLIERDLAAGRRVCPLPSPMAFGEYLLVSGMATKARRPVLFALDHRRRAKGTALRRAGARDEGLR